MAQQRSVPFSVEGSGKLQPARPFLHTLLHASPPVLLEFVNGIADDVATWARVGLLGKKVGRRAEQLADWCWLFATLVALVENGVERQVITSQQAEGALFCDCCCVWLPTCCSGRPSVRGVDDRCHGKV